MKIVICSQSFRAYFPPRICYFGDFLKIHGSSLEVIELFEESICYQFSKDTFGKLPHHVLFDGRYHKGIAMRDINLKLRKKLDEIYPDVIICGDVNNPDGAEVLRWTRKNRKGMVIFSDSRKDTFIKNVLVMAIKRALLRGVEAAIIPAPAWDDSFEWLGFSREQLFYGLNTADNTFWGQKVFNEHFKQLPSKYYLTLGRQVAMKNLENFAIAYKRYRKTGGKMPLVMVGEGKCHDRIVTVLRGVDNVTFLPFQQRENVREIFTGACCLFLPSYKIETWGMVVNEAMAGGVPIAISNQCGASTTLVEQEKNGFIYEPDNVNMIVEIMHIFEKMPKEQWNKFSQASREIISHWGVERFAQGAWDACCYAADNHRKNHNPLDWFIWKLWRGRIATDDL